MAEQFSSGYALLIAVDENAVPKLSLPVVAKDIAALEEVLIHPERCAYPRENVKVIKGKDATRANILDQLEWLENRIKTDASGNATAVVYYTGHGWRDKAAEPDEFYFIPYDVREDKIRSRALRAGDFADAVEAIGPQRLLVVLDCCHAGGMGVKEVMSLPAGYAQAAFAPAVLMGGEEAPAGPGAKGLEQLAEGSGRAVLSSSTGEQRSYVRRDGEMSIFTFHLIEALTGHAQPQEGATDVLVSDVMSYVYRHVPRSAREAYGRDQDPDFQVSGVFPIALLLGGGGWSKGQTAPDPLAKLPEAEEVKAKPSIDVGGGVLWVGDVQVTGGDLIGRDQITYGDQVSGDKISTGDITDSTVAMGRGAQATSTVGLTGEELDRLFQPLTEAVRQAPPDKRDEAMEKVEELKAEAAKGEKADDTIVAKLINGIVDLVPGAVAAVTSIFATPILGALAGPATRFVLDIIQRK
jgi:hypothetical protein